MKKKMPEYHVGNTLIIGGTGMLSGASKFVADISDHVTLCARSPHSLAEKIGANAVCFDWLNKDTEPLSELGTFDLVITWVHTEGVWVRAFAEEKLIKGGRAIRVLGSAAKDRVREVASVCKGNDDKNVQTVILGWVNDVGGQRWLTHEEISSGVIDAVTKPDEGLVIVGSLDD